MIADRLARDLTRIPDPAVDELHALRANLAAAAQNDGVLDVAYRVLDSPVGALLLAATDNGLVRVAYAVEGHDDVLQRLADRVSPRLLRSRARSAPKRPSEFTTSSTRPRAGRYSNGRSALSCPTWRSQVPSATCRRRPRR